jgi:tetratricopeptide (TPR) repeat protein
MTAKRARQPDSLVSSLQSEVAVEASPLLTFLVAHARKLAFGLVLCIVAIGGYWAYSSQSESRRAEELKALGPILVISDPQTRLEKLEAFLPTAPASVRGAAWFAVLDAASQLENQEKIHTAWSNIRNLGESMVVPAGMGMANALAAQGKYREALDVLEGLSLAPNNPEALAVQSHILLLAEILEDYPRAIVACDALLSTPGADPNEAGIWSQKKAELEKKAAGAVK